MFQLQTHKNKLTRLCNNNLAIDKLYLFGSAVTPRFNEESSDIDVFVELAELPPEVCGEKLIDLWDNLELIFNRKVDLLTTNSLRNPFLKKEVDKTKKLIYDRQNRKVFI